MVLFRKQGVVRSSFVSERMVLLVQVEKEHSEEGLLRSLLPAVLLFSRNSTTCAVPNPLLRSVVH